MEKECEKRVQAMSEVALLECRELIDGLSAAVSNLDDGNHLGAFEMFRRLEESFEYVGRTLAAAVALTRSSS